MWCWLWCGVPHNKKGASHVIKKCLLFCLFSTSTQIKHKPMIVTQWVVALCTKHIAYAPNNIMIFQKYPCVLFFFLLAFSFTFLTHSFIMLVSSHFFIFMRGEVHCIHFGRGESLTKVCQQVVVVVVVGVVVNGGGKVSLIVYFSTYNTYG